MANDLRGESMRGLEISARRGVFERPIGQTDAARLGKRGRQSGAERPRRQGESGWKEKAYFLISLDEDGAWLGDRLTGCVSP